MVLGDLQTQVYCDYIPFFCSSLKGDIKIIKNVNSPQDKTVPLETTTMIMLIPTGSGIIRLLDWVKVLKLWTGNIEED